MATTNSSLSHRQWLNVIIIAIAFMMLLFVVIGKVMEKKLSSNNSSFPFERITGIQIEYWQATVRAGEIQQSPELLTQLELSQLFRRWRSLQSYAWSNEINDAQALAVTLSFNDRDKEAWRLLLSSPPMLQKTNESKALLLDDEKLTQLIPDRLLQSRNSPGSN